jgi:glutaredoxin 2
LKKIKHEVRFLANDDVDTPTSLIGKKAVPIFEYQDPNGKKTVMPESLDIISKVDSDSLFGPTGVFKPMSKRADWSAWQERHAELMRALQRPRYIKTVLPEFASIDGKNAFVNNHPLAPYSKVAYK